MLLCKCATPGPEKMADRPDDWDQTDEAVDESFPASDAKRQVLSKPGAVRNCGAGKESWGRWRTEKSRRGP